MKKLAVLTFILCTASFSFAEDLVPATADDQEAFDQQVATQVEPVIKAEDRTAKLKKSNFGQVVSAEAKKLGANSKEQHKDMGQWVSDQRKKNHQSGNSTNGNSSSSAGDAKNSAPGEKEGSHGQSGNHRN